MRTVKFSTEAFLDLLKLWIASVANLHIQLGPTMASVLTRPCYLIVFRRSSPAPSRVITFGKLEFQA